jgi:hypothetical protein
VEEFGAVGDGATPNTAAFRRAVAELHARAGGGGARLEVPPGRWLTGSFNLTSRFTLFLHRGAVILGSQVTDSFIACAILLLFDSMQFVFFVRRDASASLYEWFEILLSISAWARAQMRDFVQLPCMDNKFRYILHWSVQKFPFSFLCAPKPEHERVLS